MNHLTYLASILLFCGVAWLVLWQKYKKILQRDRFVLVIIVALGLLFATPEYFALRWGAWYYNPQRTLGVHYITELESFGFSAGIFLCLAAITLVSADRFDSSMKVQKRRRGRFRKG